MPSNVKLVHREEIFKCEDDFSGHFFSSFSHLYSGEMCSLGDNDIYARLASVNEANSSRISRIPYHRSYSVSDELATGTVEVKTIRELIDCMKEGHIWIVATIVNLLLEKEWSYLGCKRCSKKVDKIGSKFHCKKCDRLGSSATHKFDKLHYLLCKLRVQVMDHTDFISLLLWDREATSLIGKFANELNEISIETYAAIDECSYPVELYDILDKKVLFKVTIKSSNIKVHAEVYNVVKISEDDNLIQQYSQSPQDDTFIDPDFECEQHTNADTTFKDSMAENEITSPAKTPAKRSREEDGSSVVDVGDDLAQFSSNKFQRRQFSIVVSFAMTINKSQGQSLSHVGLFLKKPVFTHGQLYIALSRLTSRKGLKILVYDDDGQITNESRNVVYKEVFRNLGREETRFSNTVEDIKVMVEGFSLLRYRFFHDAEDNMFELIDTTFSYTIIVETVRLAELPGNCAGGR
ncbi:uncharacterized protein [Nicotiana sylvestris]|uniref:uncharacterized protein n=1 Tax=Nicotiana sylvestris TaxID=4096 RepID=UPI00388CD027